MDRFRTEIRKGLFVVFDKTTGEEVFSGGKTAVEEWLDHQENMARINARKANKRRGWWARILAC